MNKNDISSKMIAYFLLFAVVAISAESSGLPCAKATYDGAPVCVCNATYCDSEQFEWVQNLNEWVIYKTSKSGDRFTKERVALNRGASIRSDSDVSITINPKESYQKIYGIGGAITDAAGINIASLSDDARLNLLRSYFSPDGIEFNILRVPIAGCDFSTRPYTYADNNWFGLTNFRLSPEDHEYKIPVIKEAQKLSQRKIILVGSAWDAPAWMKKNDFLGRPTVNPYHYNNWALYHIKFLQAYLAQGLSFDWLTTGNEMQLGAVSMSWLPEAHQKWINLFLGPNLAKFNQNNKCNVKLLMLDDQVPFLNLWQGLLRNNVTYGYLDGAATHWYLDTRFNELVFTTFHLEFPDKTLMTTECSICLNEPDFHTWTPWDRAVRYASKIIQDIQQWSNAWIDWNLVLDLQGGPNYIYNFCDAAIIVNNTANEFYKQASFYAIGQFSKFMQPNSVRVQISTTPSYVPGLDVVGVKTEDCSHITLFILNTNDYDLSINVCVEDGRCSTITATANSIISAITSAQC